MECIEERHINMLAFCSSSFSLGHNFWQTFNLIDCWWESEIAFDKNLKGINATAERRVQIHWSDYEGVRDEGVERNPLNWDLEYAEVNPRGYHSPQESSLGLHQIKSDSTSWQERWINSEIKVVANLMWKTIQEGIIRSVVRKCPIKEGNLITKTNYLFTKTETADRIHLWERFRSPYLEDNNVFPPSFNFKAREAAFKMQTWKEVFVLEKYITKWPKCSESERDQEKNPNS